MSEPSATQIELSVDVPRYRAAYQQLEQERLALPKEQVLLSLNAEVPATVITVQGALAEIRAMRPRIVEELPKFDLARFDKLELYLLALGHAHTRNMAATEPPEALPALFDQAVRTRDVLLADVQALVTRGLVNGARLTALKGNGGYRFTVYDIFLLAEILREHWDAIAGKTALTLSELNQAEALADAVSSALGEREQAPQSQAAAKDALLRSFTLFVLAYNDARRAIAYLDAANLENIAPSIYAPRGPAKKKTQPEEPVASQPVIAAPANGAPAATTNLLGTAPASNVPVGMPGADPFIRTPA
jgi:hypothetical protein